jgi:predicted signal transduction protein with EAL and GGDEF domain
LLVVIGGRLNALKGPDIMVFRMGGDEFGRPSMRQVTTMPMRSPTA